MITANNRVVVYLGADCVYIAMYAGPRYVVRTILEYTKTMGEVFRQLGEDATFLISSSVSNPQRHTEDTKLIMLCEHIYNG